MVVENILLAIAGLVGLYGGVFLTFIAPEEVHNIKKNLQRAVSVISILLFISLISTVQNVIYVLAIIIFFGWYFFFTDNRIQVRLFSILAATFPFMSTNGFAIGALFLLGLPIGTLALEKDVKKEELSISKKEALRKITKETKVFYILVILYALIQLFFR